MGKKMYVSELCIAAFRYLSRAVGSRPPAHTHTVFTLKLDIYSQYESFMNDETCGIAASLCLRLGVYSGQHGVCTVCM